MKTTFSRGCSVALLLAGFAANVSATPQNAEALAKEGHTLAEQGQLEEALAKVDQALAINPKLARAAFDRGQIRLHKGQTQGAISDLDVAVSQDPTNPRYLGARCVARVIADQAETGLSDCNAAITHSQKDSVNALTARGQAYLALKQNEAALADFKAALKEAPNAMRALYGQGIARQRLGDKQGSADVQEAINRLPGAGREYILSSLQ